MPMMGSPQLDRRVFEIANEMIEKSFRKIQNIKIKKLRNYALSLLAQVYVRMGNVNDATRMIEQIDDELYRLRALRRISAELARIGRLSLAIKFINTFFTDSPEKRLLYSDSDLSMLTDVSGEALQKVYSLDDIEIRDELLKLTVLQLIKNEELKKARRVANRILNPYFRAILLSRIGLEYSKMGSIGKAINMFNEAMKITKNLFDTLYVENEDIYESNILYKNILLAETIALNMRDANLEKWSNEIFEKILRIVDRVHDHKFRLNLVYSLIKNARINGSECELNELIEYAKSSLMEARDIYYRTQILKEIALYYFKLGYLNEFIEYIDKTIDSALEFEPGEFRDKLLECIALDCIEMGIFGCPQNLVEKINDPKIKIDILCRLSSEMLRRGYLNYGLELLDRAQKITDNDIEPNYRPFMLSKILAVLAQGGLYDRVIKIQKQLVREVERLEDDYSKAIVLGMAALFIVNYSSGDARYRYVNAVYNYTGGPCIDRDAAICNMGVASG